MSLPKAEIDEVLRRTQGELARLRHAAGDSIFNLGAKIQTD